MVQIGYKLSSEEQSPEVLVQLAHRAERAGFSFAAISDHFHPWTDRQGQSPFVWSVLGGIAQVTDRLRIGTMVTCPTLRIHPAIIAHAAATTAAMMPGRFFLGVGSGENLNEHILGDYWPPADIRLEMLEEAVAVMRLLWLGEMSSHHGPYYTVENARLYTRPEQPPPIFVAAAGSAAAEVAGRIGDGMISTVPDKQLVERFTRTASGPRPCYAELSLCWAANDRDARRIARELWHIAAVPGTLRAELPLPQHFEQAGALVDEVDVVKEVVAGPDPDAYVAKIRECVAAGFDHVTLHQIGPDQEGFFRFFERELAPRLDQFSPGERQGMPIGARVG